MENVAPGPGPGEVLRNGGSGVKQVGEGGIKRRQDWSHQTKCRRIVRCLSPAMAAEKRGPAHKSRHAQAAGPAQAGGGLERTGPEQRKVEATG